MPVGMVEKLLRLTCPHCGEQSVVVIRTDEIVAETEARPSLARFRPAGLPTPARDFKARES